MLRCKVNTDSNKKKKKTSDLLQYFQIVFDVKTIQIIMLHQSYRSTFRFGFVQIFGI